MAKTVGSDSAPKVGGKGAGAPEVKTNLVVTPELYLAAVKDITAKTEVVKAAGLVLKSARKQWRGSGIELGILDSMVKMAEWSRGEVRDHFAIQAQYAEWLGLPVSASTLKQGDLTRGLDDDEVQRREWFATGRTYSRTGKSGRPPEECPGEFHQAFMAGFNEEDEAAWLDSDGADQQEPVAQPTLADAMAEAMIADGEPMPYDQPDWKGFSEDPQDWFAAQWRDFNHWFDSVPDGANVRIAHPGIVIAFRGRRDGLMDESGAPTDKAIAEARAEAAASAPSAGGGAPDSLPPPKAKGSSRKAAVH